MIKCIKSILWLFSIAITINAQAHTHLDKEHRFERAIKKKHFKVRMSHSNLKKDHDASTLLISCVDFRLRDETKYLMSKVFGLKDDYDEIALPGAALALANDKYPHWTQTIEEIIVLLQGLHNIKRVILLDHRQCGAYNLIVGKDHAKTKESELAAHKEVLNKARRMIKNKMPDLKVYSLLMGLDGVVENITG
jgi:carbonic anhydrase